MLLYEIILEGEKAVAQYELVFRLKRTLDQDSRPHVDVVPVRGNALAVGLTPATPPQPALGDDATEDLFLSRG